MNLPLVSVIIPNYNYARYLSEAVESVINQTYTNVEIVVVDDGSQDDSKEILDSYGKRINSIFQQNQGVAAARNNGVKVSGGEFIAFLDADDAWLPAKIEKQIEMFAGDHELGMVHAGVVEIDGKGNKICELTNGMGGRVAEDLLRFELPVILGGGSGIMVRREAFDAVGGFDQRLSTSADWDFFYEVSRHYNVGFVTDILLKYRKHGSNMHGNIERMEREMLLGFEKAFETDDPQTQSLRRTAYGNLHRVLAGSYYRAGQYVHFAEQATKSLWYRPANWIHFVNYPKRLLQRGK